MGQTSSGEEGDLLASSDGVHHVDSRDSRLDHFLRVDSLIGVDRLALLINIKQESGIPRYLRTSRPGLVGRGQLGHRSRWRTYPASRWR